MTDYRKAAQAMAGPGREHLVERIARHHHHNESLHMHNAGPVDQCSYCWLRAGRALQALAELDFIARIDNPDQIPMELAKQRLALRLTQSEVARRMGMKHSATAIGAYERGERQPGLHNLQIWADVLNQRVIVVPRVAPASA